MNFPVTFASGYEEKINVDSAEEWTEIAFAQNPYDGADEAVSVEIDGEAVDLDSDGAWTAKLGTALADAISRHPPASGSPRRPGAGVFTEPHMLTPEELDRMPENEFSELAELVNDACARRLERTMDLLATHHAEQAEERARDLSPLDNAIRLCSSSAARLIKLIELKAPSEIIVNECGILSRHINEAFGDGKKGELTPERQRGADAWTRTILQANDLDPAIREALRPVYDRLKAEAPNAAPAMALAMIARALRSMKTGDGSDPGPYREALTRIALIMVGRDKSHPA